MIPESVDNPIRSRRLWLPFLTLLLSMLLTALVTVVAAREARERDRLRFERAVDRVRESIETRLGITVGLLRGLAAHVDTSPGVDRDSFRAYVDRLDLPGRYPGLLGIGYTVRIRPEERRALVQRMHEEGAEDFRLWPPGDRPEYHAILYLEPLEVRNRAAIGYDMFSEPTRRLAMERARDTGLPAASGKVELVQEIDDPKQAGFLIYVPIYRGGQTPDSVAERRRLLQGFAYAPIRAGDLLKGILGTNSPPGVAFQIFDGMAPAPEQLLHRSGSGGSGTPGAASPRFAATRRLEIAGRSWYLRFSSEPAFEAASGPSVVVLTGFAGGIISLLLFAVTWVQARGREEAERSAAELLRLQSATRSAQDALREGEGQLRLITDAVPSLISYVDASGRYRFNNRAYEQWFGRSRAEIQGKHLREVLGREAYEAVRPHVEAALSGREARYEIRVPYRHGGESAISAVYIPDLAADGTVQGFVGLVNDITERIRVEEALRRSEEQLREEAAIISTINRIGATLVSELDQQKLVQSLTDAATELVGAEFGAFFYNLLDERGESYALYTLSGAPREAFAQFPMPRNTEVFGPTFRGEGIVRSDDITKDPRYGKHAPHYGMPEGHLPVRSYLAAPVISRSGEVLGGLFFGHEQVGVFTERDEQLLQGVTAQAAIALDNAHLYRQAQQARIEAENASRLKDEFLATVSHELRTPLNAILGYAQLLRQGEPSPERLAKGLETIERNVKIQAQLINDLLDVSRIISGKLRLDVQPVDLASVIQAAIDSVQPAAEAKGIRIQRVLDPLAAKISGDPGRLQQVVWNLLSNAIKFTPGGGRVQVLLERVNSHLEITVSDTGVGIVPEFLPHVFDRFRQVDGSSTRRHGGLGLGLAIVRHLVELHGGSVRAKSGGEGQGATFIVALPLPIVHDGWGSTQRVHPLAEPPHRPSTPDGPLECPPSLAGLQILVVDDEPDARELMTQILEACEATVLAVPSTAAALKAMERFRPDVLLSDIGMPEQDGYDLIRQVRALPEEQGGAVPAAALTAFARAEDRRRALLSGFQAHLAKPIERDDLLTIVASLTGRTQPQR
jgi:PAS domain S-box-containing protein